ncbi:MAG: Gfo/Idh/MocA family oxidoreductase [Planctomycetes bacterium]|nr:Gfo/Idh/MocA family oxidoreductase [Planctomycetota bacterium]
MNIDFHGNVTDEPRIRAGFIGCGSHSFRNLYPVFSFAPVDLVATCDLDAEKAKRYAEQFGADASYGDHWHMLEQEELDAVFICTGYDEKGRPLYPDLAVECLDSGCHVWIEKPPAATCEDIQRMQKAADSAGKNVLVGFKKMFFPANEKAKELMDGPDFGFPQMALLRYPQYVPTRSEFRKYFDEEQSNAVRGFLDHLCHPVSLLVFLLGMPTTLYYERSDAGGGLASFRYQTGAVASIALTRGASSNGGMERTTIVSDTGGHITVENGVRVTLHRTPPNLTYGATPSYYSGNANDVSALWEPEFSLGQLYNKGLFLLGYYNEINEFARSILDDRSPEKGTLREAWQITRIFEAFAKGPGQPVKLDRNG